MNNGGTQTTVSLSVWRMTSQHPPLPPSRLYYIHPSMRVLSAAAFSFFKTLQRRLSKKTSNHTCISPSSSSHKPGLYEMMENPYEATKDALKSGTWVWKRKRRRNAKATTTFLATFTLYYFIPFFRFFFARVVHTFWKRNMVVKNCRLQ